ncbi:multiple C2 and transmembrane domain-containing protein isoform X4 [Neodiprion fabricii]|uniref:multiple C2 and transmembrane domain-containing protein isoform X4 n=1 Tax=Neodiprion fabricii TaxID=2872261 RepID=UPI001ED94FBA|nr:multiple C2 and transmembrane domain-containing protein isoform X4 [Neodiprion fabricii]
MEGGIPERQDQYARSDHEERKKLLVLESKEEIGHFLRTERVHSTIWSSSDSSFKESPNTGPNEVPKRDRKSRKSGTASSLRSVIERRVEQVERMLEDRVEKAIEDRLDKHPWLHPIEAWIADKCNNSKPPSPAEKRRDYSSDSDLGGGKSTENVGGVKEKKLREERGVVEHLRSFKARHEKLVSRGKADPEGGNPAFGIRESSSDHGIFERRVLEHFRGPSPVPPKRRGNKESGTMEHRGTREFQLARSSTLPDNPVADPSSDTIFTQFKHSVTPPPNIGYSTSDTHCQHHQLELIAQTRQQQQSQDFIEKIKEGFKEKREELHRYFQRNTRLVDVNRKLKSQIWSSVVTIVLVEAKNLLPMDIEGLSDPYVKFRLGTEKYKSKVVHKTLSPVWLEQFDLHLYEDVGFGQELEVTIWDRDKSRDDLMGRAVINLATLEREKTHRLWRDLEDGAGSVFLLLTISGTTASETISDLAAHEETPQEKALLLQRYSLLKTFQRPQDVGHLTVKVFRAQGLAAADLGGKSDPFCVLELVNARLQTQTEYKTLAPNWQKIFTFNVKDINSVLEVTVYDEDRDHKVEFLGKVAIPLLRIHNGEKRWYALKDKKLRGRAKGNSPQILMEMTVIWNPLRACARTLNPKERKYMEPEVKFKRQVFLRNVLRLKAIIVFFIDNSKYIQSCFEWESTPRSVIAFALFILLCYYFEPYMIPTAALLVFLKYYIVSNKVALVTGWPAYHPSGNSLSSHDSNDLGSDEAPSTPGGLDDDDDEDDKDKEEKKSLKERLQAIQEVTQTVQNSIGYIASLGESIKNTFNFTVPYLSYLAMVLAFLGAVVLYFVPIRYLIMAWGVNKFFRKILRPHTVPNNELLDLLSRVPNDEDLISYRELKPVPTPDCERSGVGGAAVPTGSGAPRKDHQRRKKTA